MSRDIFRRNRGLWVYALLYQCTLSIFSSYENFYQYNYLAHHFCLFHFTILALHNIEKVLSIWKINFVRAFGDSVELGAISFYVSIKIITVYISTTMRFLSFIYGMICIITFTFFMYNDCSLKAAIHMDTTFL